jgi:mannose-6-phosphate isomerase
VVEGSFRILEISFGEFDEDDIVRLEDVYGRAGP